MKIKQNNLPILSKSLIIHKFKIKKIKNDYKLLYIKSFIFK